MVIAQVWTRWKMNRLLDGFLKAVGGAKSWTAEKHQFEALVKLKKNPTL